MENAFSWGKYVVMNKTMKERERERERRNVSRAAGFDVL